MAVISGAQGNDLIYGSVRDDLIEGGYRAADEVEGLEWIDGGYLPSDPVEALILNEIENGGGYGASDNDPFNLANFFNGKGFWTGGPREHQPQYNEPSPFNLSGLFDPRDPALLDEQETGVGNPASSNPVSTISFDDNGGYRVPDIDEVDFEFL